MFVNKEKISQYFYFHILIKFYILNLNKRFAIITLYEYDNNRTKKWTYFFELLGLFKMFLLIQCFALFLSFKKKNVFCARLLSEIGWNRKNNALKIDIEILYPV